MLLIPELSDTAVREAAKRALQSVGRIGSQAAKTLTLVSGCCSSIFWTAEAPRRQTGQVGDSSRMIRT